MRNVALEEQAVEALLAKAKVTEKATTFSELMNQTRRNGRDERRPRFRLANRRTMKSPRGCGLFFCHVAD